ncbi:hypothetical protein QBC39DRAFT_355779 [Podospora conica]|nr:hypothetical protein QBC39DRAFT_355779 [Schizothecium conicum]
MATFRIFLTFLALVGACLALPTANQASDAVDSQISARDAGATVSGELCGTNGPWGSATPRRLKVFFDTYGTNPDAVVTFSSRTQGVCLQVACAEGAPGTIWACLRKNTRVGPGRSDPVSFKQAADGARQIYDRCPNTYTGRAVFQGVGQNWDIVVSGHSCEDLNVGDDLNDPHWGLP